MREALVKAYSTPVPRYTSYPTAPHFHDGVTARDYAGWLDALAPSSTVSLYIHIPFCDRLCWFCACHTKQVLRYEPVAAYLESLIGEIGMVADRIGSRTVVTSIHLGGGSPTMLTGDDLKRLFAALENGFSLSEDAQISIEIDANDIDDDKLSALARVGVTRASLGVQDFDPAVQQAINRHQSFEKTRAVIDGLRVRGIDAINLDMLYGLPHQTEASIVRTAEQVATLDPDRVALFGYAHVPWMKTHQKMIPEDALPDILARFRQAQRAGEALKAHGLDPVGMDHFAKPSDPLAWAARNGTLARNFQGYTTDTADALIGLGASSIGLMPQGYVQNLVPTAQYMRAIAAGNFPIAKGFALTDDDRMRAWAIERIMCDFALSRSAVKAKFGRRAQPLLAAAETFLASHADGLFVREDDIYRVTPQGRPFVRQFAALFDAYRTTGQARHSVAV